MSSLHVNMITSVMAAYSWLASSVFSLSVPFKSSLPSGYSSVRSGWGARLPRSSEVLIGLPLARLAVPQGGAMNTMSNLSLSATMISSSSCSCEGIVRSSVMISTPQLLLVVLSIAMPRTPSFLKVLVKRADPAQTSITSNSSTFTPAKLRGSCCD